MHKRAQKRKCAENKGNNESIKIRLGDEFRYFEPNKWNSLFYL